jgi:hypothetical protein
MGNHPFNVIVILFWCATMSWLLVAKILPPLRVGEPPNYASILKATDAETPVCWSIRLNDKTIGWAANKMVRRKDGITDLYSRVYLGEFPWEEFAPGWLGAVLKPVFTNLDEMDVDKTTRLVIDPLGRLVEFESRVRVANIPDAVKVQGQVEGSTLRLSIKSGEFPYKTERYLPPNAMMGDEFSPQVLMPGLRLGQSWTVPLYSPFRTSRSPLEILQAVVEREDRLTWNGQSIPCRVIVYRGDPGSGLAGNEIRGRVWVDQGGLVVRQEIAILKSHLHFIRLGVIEADNVWKTLGEDWTANLSGQVAKRLLQQVRADSP